MMDNNFSRDEILSKLHEGEVTVTFTKADGSERVMRCSLNESLLPPATPSEGEAKERKVNLAAIPVFDLDVQGWRSFRVDSVKSVA